MNDKKFEEKFRYLIKEAEKKLNITDTDSFNSEDRINIENTIDYLVNKKTEKCKNEIEELSKHSSNFSNLENLDNIYPEKGHKKEFEESSLKLQECLKPMNFMIDNFKEHVSIFENLVQGSFDLCLNSIKDEINKGKVNEKIARSKIDTCYNYLNRNKNSTSSLMKDIILNLKEKY